MYMEQVSGFTVAGFALNEKALEFYKWFKTSNYMEEFELEIKEYEGEKALEVSQFNPFFSIDSLYEVFLIDSGAKDHVCENCENHSAARSANQ